MKLTNSAVFAKIISQKWVLFPIWSWNMRKTSWTTSKTSWITSKTSWITLNIVKHHETLEHSPFKTSKLKKTKELINTGHANVTCINKCLCQHTDNTVNKGRAWKTAFAVAYCVLNPRFIDQQSWARVRSYIFNFQLLGIELSTNFVYQTNNNHCVDVITIWNNLKQFWKHWTGAAPLLYVCCFDLLGFTLQMLL